MNKSRQRRMTIRANWLSCLSASALNLFAKMIRFVFFSIGSLLQLLTITESIGSTHHGIVHDN